MIAKKSGTNLVTVFAIMPVMETLFSSSTSNERIYITMNSIIYQRGNAKQELCNKHLAPLFVKGKMMLFVLPMVTIATHTR